MPAQSKRDIGCFTADFRDGKVIVGGKTALSGYFFMNGLNEYWNPEYEVAARLNAFHHGIWICLPSIILTGGFSFWQSSFLLIYRNAFDFNFLIVVKKLTATSLKDILLFCSSD